MSEGGRGQAGVPPRDLRSLQALLDELRSGLDQVGSDADLINQLSALESVISACGAAQIRLTHELHERRVDAVRVRLQDAAGSALKVATARATLWTGKEIGLARRESTAVGRALLTVADTVCTWLPRTLAELEAGRTTAYRVRLVADAAGRLPEDQRAAFDDLMAPQLDGATNGQVERRAAAAIYRLDPDGALARIRRSIVERGVSSRPVGDGLVRVSITAPLVGGVAGYAALRKEAESARFAGDPRTLDQIMSDEAITRLTGGAVTGCDADGLPTRAPWVATADPFAAAEDPVSAVKRRAAERRSATAADTGGARPDEPVPVQDDSATAQTAADGSPSAETVTAPADGSVSSGLPVPVAGWTPRGGHLPAPRCSAGVTGGTPMPAVAESLSAAFSPMDPSPTQPPATQVSPTQPLPVGSSPIDEWEEMWWPSEAPEWLIDDDPPAFPDDVALFAWLDKWSDEFFGPEPVDPVADPDDPDVAIVRDEGAVSGGPPASGLQIHLHLILSDRTLLSADDEPAVLLGHGPIPAGTARRMATLTDDLARTTLRRYVTDPVNGRLADSDPRVREFPQVVKEFLATRDLECRGPWCGASIRQFDHVVPVAAGGPTLKENGQGLCVTCNQVKETPGWHAVVDEATGAIATRTPTGHTHTSPEPRPVGAG